MDEMPNCPEDRVTPIRDRHERTASDATQPVSETHELKSRFKASWNLIPAHSEVITPQMLTLVDLDQQHIDSIVKTVVGGARNIQDIYPLSPLQEGMLFHHLMSKQNDSYFFSTLFELKSRRELGVFIASLQTVIDRHDILRTAVLWEKLPQPVQVVHRRATLPIEEVAVDDEGELLDELKRRMRPQNQRLDLTRAPLLRLLVGRRVHDSGSHVLMQVHHLVCDYQARKAVVAEIMTCLEGQQNQLLRPAPYREYIAQLLEQAHAREPEEYFRINLGDFDEPTAPFGLCDVHGDGSQIAEAIEPAGAALTQQVRLQARQLKVSAARLVHAAVALVVARTSGRDDVVFGTVLSSRHSIDPERHMLGMSINTLPLRFRLQEVTAKELVERTHQGLAALLKLASVPLMLAQRSSGVSGATPLFTTILNCRREAPNPESEKTSSASARMIAHRGALTNYPVAIQVDDVGDDLVLTAQTDARIDPYRMVGYLRTAIQSLVEALAHAPQTPALALAVLPHHERELLVGPFNQTRQLFPQQKLVHELFEEQVVRAPDATAVVFADQQLTYAQLDRRANQLAHLLLARGVQPDQRVGLCVERSLEMIVGWLGILKAGSAYVPLDGSYPAERLSYMLCDSAPVAVVTQERFRNILPACNAPMIAFDTDKDEIDNAPDYSPNAARMGLTPGNLASVIYTSGSTGLPKGVMVEHAGLCNLAYAQRSELRVQPDSRVLQFASLSFDACTWECVMALCNGARLCVAPREDLIPGEPLLRMLRAQGITHATLPPVALSALPYDEGLPLRTLIVAGDVCSVGLAQQWARGLRFINAYGPTEATVCASMHQCVAQDTEGLPIGRPIANASIHILDAHGELVPIGVLGEIHIGGAGVARGYLGNPELTARHFIRDPFCADGRGRLYKSGDLGRWRPDGQIEFAGRNDHQVKIRGFRVELGEIETRLAQHEMIREAAVVAREDIPGEKRLVAYVATRGQSRPSVEELRSHVKSALPEYMVPGAVVILESLPLTPSGKVDRRALSAPQLGDYATREYEEPRGEVEESLARIWQELLQVSQVGRRENFFELGGHSLLAVKSLLNINEACGCRLTVADIYKNPTLCDLAARIGGAAKEDELVDLSREAALDDSVVARPGFRRVRAQHILLTGATGFVGRFLLVQLLRDTDAIIYCLVRARSKQQAFSRVKTTLLKWDLWRQEFERRIVAIPGDLALPRLGVDESDFQMLARAVDSIYHCATSMNHLETYAMAKPANVEAVREVLKLATEHKSKVINYISSLSVFRSSATDAPRVVHEHSSIDNEQHSSSRGYVASKWVAEKIIMTAAERGIPCNIFRVGLVWADAQAGRYDELQQAYRVFKSCLMSGYGIRHYRYQMAPTPVDYVARAIVFLANRHGDGQGVFHISSSRQMSEGVFERCNEVAGTSLVLLSYYEWIGEIKRLHQAGRSLPAVPLIEFAFFMDAEAFDEHQRRTPSANLTFDCARTHQELESAGIVAPALNDDLLRIYVKSMFQRDADLHEVIDSYREVMVMERESASGPLRFRPSAN